MLREIYELNAKVIDANSTFNTLSGYPKTFDSRSYSNDLEKTRQRALGGFYEVLGAMAKIDSRKLQIATLTRISDGVQIAVERFGDMPEDPDPEPEPEEPAE